MQNTNPGPNSATEKSISQPTIPDNEPSLAPKPRLIKQTANKPQVLSIWRSLQTIISVAIICATLFTLWTPANLFSNQLLEKMWQSVNSQTNQLTPNPSASTPTPPVRPPIGIVAGHWQNDSGAVCSDGLTEKDVNLRIATLVRQNLVEQGYDVDLMGEFDKKLNQYQALALVSIHNDSCDFINNDATGFKVATALSNKHPEKTSRLTACLTQHYQSITSMKNSSMTITRDMTEYHAFSEINDNTPAAIIETGFLNLDRQVLTQRPDLIAQGITAGILCFIENEPLPMQNVTPTLKP